MLEKLRGRKPTLIDMESYRRSAVVIPLIETENGYEVLFEVRAIGLKHQPGEICFPGGGCDKGEAPEAAAFREICEELLLSSDQVQLEAPMDIFVSPFNMVIYPYLGTLKSYEGTYSRDEVLEIFTVPLGFLWKMNRESTIIKYTQNHLRIFRGTKFRGDTGTGGIREPIRCFFMNIRTGSFGGLRRGLCGIRCSLYGQPAGGWNEDEEDKEKYDC